MAGQREWTTRFFPDELMTSDSDDLASDNTTDWTGAGKVLWAAFSTKNQLNPRINPNVLIQPEVIDSKWDDKDTVSLTLFMPSNILAKARAKTPLDPIPTTLLLGRGDEELGYGLRFYFQRAGTGALVCMSGREGGDPGGRWNVGLTQEKLEKFFKAQGLKGRPEIQVLAGYSTGYGMVQTINNDLIPLAKIKRLIFFDCIYRTDKPALPKGEAPPILATGDKPEFTSASAGRQILDEHKEAFRAKPFNTRRAITRLTSASSSCLVAGYAGTSGGSPHYGIWDAKAANLLTLGQRTLVELPTLSNLRDEKAASGSSWSPSEAFETLILSRYLDLGAKAGLIGPSDIPKPFPAIIAATLPVRGTVSSSAAVAAVTTLPKGVKATALTAWANGLSVKPKPAERIAAARVLRQHQLVLPGWLYDIKTDVSEYRHAGPLMEFGWELLPP